MLNTKVWENACGLVRTVVEGVGVDTADGSIIVSVRPNAKADVLGLRELRPGKPAFWGERTKAVTP